MLGLLRTYIYHPLLRLLPNKPVSNDHPGGHDAPARLRDQDDLNRWTLSKSVLRAIEGTPDDWSIRIALHGKWGTGKTSVLNFIEAQIGEQNHHISRDPDSLKVVVVRFSAWNASGEGGVITRFYEALSEQLPIRQQWYARTWRWTTRRFRAILNLSNDVSATVAEGASASGAPVTAASIAAFGTAMKKVGEWSTVKKEHLLKLQNALEGYRVVVFIDDLDRADPTIIPKTMLALRELLDWPKFAFVLAFDPEIIGTALSRYSETFGKDAKGFLEKIIDFQLTLPEPTTEQVEKMGKRAFETCCPFIPSETLEHVYKWLPNNPRLCKVIVRDLGLLKTVATRHAPSELNWKAIILQTILKHEAPETLQVVNRTLIGIGQTPVRMTMDKTKRGEREKEMAHAVLLSVSDGLGEESPQYKALLPKVLDLQILRRDETRERINYEMGLLIAEPGITLQEYFAFLDKWTHIHDEQYVTELVALGVQASHQAPSEVAAQLFLIAMMCYSQEIGAATRELNMSNYTLTIQRAERHVDLLDNLWCLCGDPSVVAVRVRYSLFNRLSQVAKHGHVNEWQLERCCLLRRVDSLVLDAAKICESPIEVFDEGLNVAQQAQRLPGTATDRSLEMYRATSEQLEASAVDDIVGCFDKHDEILKIYADLSGANHMRRFRLTSMSSPLYGQAGTEKLLDVLCTPHPDRARNIIVAGNAMHYLQALMGRWQHEQHLEGRNTYWAILERLAPAAWACVMSVGREDRRPKAYLGKRAELLAGGFPEEWLPMPKWLES
ncbi:hypothetical protein HZF02_15070 [Pseudomonas yamanorum]|nr:hypothetical protein HZF02_15070 [Pseudomonas yamanorum]